MGMAMREQRILLAAGFNIMRCNLILKQIWKCSSPGSWKLHSKHETQASTQRAWNELMKDHTKLAG
jgi:hypothetical protein